MNATATATATRTSAQQRAAMRLTRAGYSVEFQDRGYGQVTLLAADPAELYRISGRSVDWTTDSTHFVRLRWQDGRFYDALVNYDGGALDFRSISGALAEVVWW